MPRTEREVTVLNSQGLHARPAALFVQIASKYDASVTIAKDGEVVNGKSIMGILMLGAQQNSQLKIVAEGDDSEAMVNELADFLTKHE